MDALYHCLNDVSPLNREVRLKVTIVRIWKLHLYDDDKQIISSLEMVLADQQGYKIQASFLEGLVQLFHGRFIRGRVYIMSSFKVVQIVGSYLVTNHGYRLIFLISTFVLVTDCILNPMDSLSVVDSSIIYRHQNDCDFLAGQFSIYVSFVQVGDSCVIFFPEYVIKIILHM